MLPLALVGWFYCLTNGTACFLRVQFWLLLKDHIFGAPWLKTYRTWSSPWKIRELGKTEQRPPTEGIITFLIAYRRLRTLKSKIIKNPTLFSSKLWNFSKFENFARISKFFKFVISSLGVWNNYSKMIRKTLPLWRDIKKKPKQQINTY